MKKLSFVLTVALMTIATTASAQFANSGKKSNGAVANTENYSRARVAYNAFSFSGDGVSLDLTGISLEWTKGINIASNMPLYVETGLNVMYAFGSKSGVDTNYLGVNVPVLLTYKITPNDTMSILPYAGLNLRGNILGDQSDGDYKMDFFDDYDAKRFGVGASLGVNLDFKSLSVGLGYTFDFTEMMEGVDVNYFSVAIGWKF